MTMARIGRFPEDFVLRFLDRLTEMPPPPAARHLGPCQICGGALTADGYGHMSLDGGDEPAHFVGFELYHGHRPRGEVLRHMCGRRSCCAGRHLVEGTQKQNLADAVAHGTHVPPPHPCGQDHPQAALDDAGIAEVKRRLAAGETQTSIAAAMGVSQPLISSVSTGKARTCRRTR